MPQPQVRQKNQGGKRMLPFFGYFVDVVANWQEPSNFGIRRDSRPSGCFLRISQSQSTAFNLQVYRALGPRSAKI
jgi:hypothetical protein